MSHSRIWEKENEHCYFEDGQLRNMICSWEPNFTDLTVDDCKYAIGISFSTSPIILISFSPVFISTIS